TTDSTYSSGKIGFSSTYATGTLDDVSVTTGSAPPTLRQAAASSGTTANGWSASGPSWFAPGFPWDGLAPGGSTSTSQPYHAPLLNGDASWWWPFESLFDGPAAHTMFGIGHGR